VRFAVSPMDLASVRAAAVQVKEPLDAIVLNAGGRGEGTPPACEQPVAGGARSSRRLAGSHKPAVRQMILQ
jgi:hypothetical protein